MSADSRGEVGDAMYPFIEPDGPLHVIDRNGIVWRVVRDGGMVTCADHTRIYSGGIQWLADNHGPLTSLNTAPTTDETRQP